MATIAEIVHQQVQVAGSSSSARLELGHQIVQVAGSSLSRIRLAHIVIQVVRGTPLPPQDDSGIYFAGKGQRHDRYFSGNRKIPNPTIRTALIGD